MKKIGSRSWLCGLIVLVVTGLNLVSFGSQGTVAEAVLQQQQIKIVASDEATTDLFGWSVALSSDGRTALVGTPGKNAQSGSAYVFTRSNSGSVWSQQQKLVAADVSSGDQFGLMVALSANGNTALVSAIYKNAQRGAVYVFTRDKDGTKWSQKQQLTAFDATPGDQFGNTVAISNDGNTALIGAFRKNSMSGVAYVFTLNNSTDSWNQQQSLTASDGVANDYFGNFVSLSGDGNTALIGAFGKNSFSGAAYVFGRDKHKVSWSQQQKLGEVSPNSGDYFGNCVMLSADGNVAVVGSPGRNSYGGGAYMFTRNSGTGWSQQPQLLAADIASNDFFGQWVSLSANGNKVLIGAPGKASNSGAAYQFVRVGTNWVQQQKTPATDAASGDKFGTSVALSGDGRTAVVAADGKNSQTGAAYLLASPFRISPRLADFADKKSQPSTP